MMLFTKHLRPGIRSGRIRTTVRIWSRQKVKVGGRYRFDDGHVVVDSIKQIKMKDVTDDLARETGFENRKALLGIAKHGPGDNVYLIRFHYLAAGAWDASDSVGEPSLQTPSGGDLMSRILSATPLAPEAPEKKASGRKKPSVRKKRPLAKAKRVRKR